MTKNETTIEACDSLEMKNSNHAYVALIKGKAPFTVPLPPNHEISIGRSRSSAIHVDDPSVSRLHATLKWDGGQTVQLTDHKSRNGTFIKGKQLKGTVEIGSGVDFNVGNAHFVLSIPYQQESSTSQGDARTEDHNFIARAPSILRAMTLADRAAATDTTVLIVGETGVGKEVFANRIHQMSSRKSKVVVAVNCGAIPETLAESSLFGHEKGAFTGALSRQIGFFEKAQGGTLFLDEVGELSLPMQIRLLRVLDNRTIMRVGSNKPISIDVRIVAATNANLEKKVEDGTFRKDLLFRLDILKIDIPPLRSRIEDIKPLVEYFLQEMEPKKQVLLNSKAFEILHAYPWPGNVRELRNCLERSLAMRESDILGEQDIIGLKEEELTHSNDGKVESQISTIGTENLKSKINEVEREAILEALKSCNDNQTKAAKKLGMSRRCLIYKLEKYGLKPAAASRRP